MTDSVPEHVSEALRNDLHGESLGTEDGVYCDFCDGMVDIDTPVLYEALHFKDMAGVENLLAVPDMWILDGIRCAECAIETIDPETNGVEEALFRLRVTEANGVYSVDSTTLSVLSYSPGESGYYPPVLSPQTIVEHMDLGLTRWHRIRELLEGNDAIVTRSPITEILTYSREVPPAIAAFDPES
jgi:hypothetical protein